MKLKREEAKSANRKQIIDDIMVEMDKKDKNKMTIPSQVSTDCSHNNKTKMPSDLSQFSVKGSRI